MNLKSNFIIVFYASRFNSWTCFHEFSSAWTDYVASINILVDAFCSHFLLQQTRMWTNGLCKFAHVIKFCWEYHLCTLLLWLNRTVILATICFLTIQIGWSEDSNKSNKKNEFDNFENAWNYLHIGEVLEIKIFIYFNAKCFGENGKNKLRRKSPSLHTLLSLCLSLSLAFRASLLSLSLSHLI